MAAVVGAYGQQVLQLWHHDLLVASLMIDPEGWAIKRTYAYVRDGEDVKRFAATTTLSSDERKVLVAEWKSLPDHRIEDSLAGLFKEGVDG